VRSFKRVHNTGTNAEITQHSDVWRIQLKLREPNHNPMTITGYVAHSLALAEKLADKEIANSIPPHTWGDDDSEAFRVEAYPETFER
jgi:hypothetical protein